MFSGKDFRVDVPYVVVPENDPPMSDHSVFRHILQRRVKFFVTKFYILGEWMLSFRFTKVYIFFKKIIYPLIKHLKLQSLTMLMKQTKTKKFIAGSIDFISKTICSVAFISRVNAS